MGIHPIPNNPTTAYPGDSKVFPGFRIHKFLQPCNPLLKLPYQFEVPRFSMRPGSSPTPSQTAGPGHGECEE